MKKIPLNSLVFVIDVDSSTINQRFEPHEIISVDSISTTLVGSSHRPDLRGVIQAEVERLAFLKLSLGQRVVIDIPDLRVNSRISFAKQAVNKGYHVFYLVDDLRIRSDLTSGDRIADVIDLKTPFDVVSLVPDVDFFDTLINRGFNGVTVIPDVHGSMNPLRNAISWAKSRNHFMLFLGDLIDYGIDAIAVVEEVYQLVIRGEAEALMGNHERKIYRYLSQREQSGFSHMKLSQGNQITIDRVDSLSKFDHDRWVTRFKSLVHMMRNHRTSHGFIFAHGAVDPLMWSNTNHRLPSFLEDIALYGEVDKENKLQGGYPNRIYNWVDSLHTGQIAVVGHDIRSNYEPLKHTSKNGGTAIFLDTGCGKGGHLSTLDLRFDTNIVRVENFNLH